MPETAQLVALTLSLVLIAFTSAIFGLIQHRVLMDADSCCVKNTTCAVILKQQHEEFYDRGNGVQTRFIFSILFFIITGCLRFWHLPAWVSCLQNSFVLKLLALVAYTSLMLFVSSTRTFTVSVNDLNKKCAIQPILAAIEVLSSFVLVISAVLFYFFMLTPKIAKKNNSLPIFALSEFSDDSEEDI